jgi:pyruvate/2-oxoglutarate dehydrogenase complex dihydrolipoamide acyltransferase (E2) component
VEAPGAGTIVQLYDEGVEVELGNVVARIAESAQELASLESGAEASMPTPRAAEGERKATRKAVELAERHGIDLSAIEKRGFITEKDVEALIARHAAEAVRRATAAAGVSTEGVTLPALFDPTRAMGASTARSSSSSRRIPVPSEVPDQK